MKIKDKLSAIHMAELKTYHLSRRFYVNLTE